MRVFCLDPGLLPRYDSVGALHVFAKSPLLHFEFIAAAPAVQAQAAKQIPLRDFFKNPDQAAHALSPDGQYLAWLAPWESRRNIYVRPLAGGPQPA